MLLFTREGHTVGVDPRTWADIFDYFSEAGWTPPIQAYRLLQTNVVNVGKDEALAFAEAGRVVLEEAIKDPLSASSTITFDMGKFAELIEFASEGQFTITQRT